MFLIATVLALAAPQANLEAATSPQVELTDPMVVPRQGHTAVALSDGRVLITGGRNESGVLASAELYDPATRKFSPAGLMNESRWGHTANLLSDGRVLISGGHDGAKALLTAEVFEIKASGSYFRRLASGMKTARFGHTASVLSNGQVLLVGGNEGGTAELFDPSRELFAGELLRMGVARRGHTATLLGTENVFLTGGGNRSAEFYKIGDNRFSLWPNPMVEERTGHAAIISDEGRIVLVGGDAEGTAEEMDGTTGAFRMKLVLGKGISSATKLANGRVLVLGPDMAGIYSPAGNGFEQMGGMASLERRGQSVTELQGERRVWLVAGGVNKNDQLLAEAVLFNPAIMRTDADQYDSGSVVTIEGRGFQAEEEVEVEVTREDGKQYDGKNHWLVVADGQGTFSTSWQVCAGDCLGAAMRVSAVALASGLRAQTGFRVSNENPGAAVASTDSGLARTTRKLPVTMNVTSPTTASPVYIPTTTLPRSQTIGLTYSSDTQSGPSPTLAARIQTSGGTVIASGSKQVQKKTTPTADSIALTIPAGTSPGSYDVVGSLTDGGVTKSSTNVQAVIVCNGAAITAQPASQTICTNTTASFSVTATGTSLSYQWRKNGGNLSDGGRISGATSASLSINGALAADAGTYSCVVSSLCGPTSVTSSNATLTLRTPVSITTQPVGGTNCVGASRTFSVVAAGDGPLSYQWYFGSNPVGANSSSYTLGSVSTGDAGAYSVKVTGPCGDFVTSSTATLTVNSPPSITVQPNSTTLCPGNAFSVSVVASGTVTSYQWRKNGTTISGATSSTYNIGAVAAGDAGSYDVVITGPCGSVTSSAATLTVSSGVTITSQPASQTKCVGESVTFSVSASGTGPFTYQWSKAGAAIGGATSSSYTISAVASGDAASYTVQVIGACASTNSTAAVLTVNTPVSITAQPVTQSKCVGDSVSFSVTATGTGPLTYQWQKDGVNISGATSSTLNKAGLLVTDTGNYTVVITGACGTVTSSQALLTVNSPPAITTQPASQTNCVGNSVTFSVSTTGSGWSYQWTKVGVGPIPGATASSYTIPSLQSGDNNTSYAVTVSGTCGSVTSSQAVLTVWSPPSIGTNPSSLTRCAGPSSTATFTVSATGSGLTYQWRKNGANLTDGGNISGATTTSLTVSAIGTTDAGSYDVVVSNTCSSQASTAATLTVPAPPSITTQPSTQASCTGSTVTLSVTAAGGGLTYQWRKNGVNLVESANVTGTTSATLVLTSIQTSDSGDYTVVVAGTCGTPVTSQTATLSVASGTGTTAISGPTHVCTGAQGVPYSTSTGGGTYNWTVPPGSTIVSGAGTSSITVNFGSNSGVVSIGVGTGSCTSSLTITVSDAPTILGSPALSNQSVCVGAPVTFAVTSVGQGLTYQWRKNGVSLLESGNVTGTTTATLSIAAATASDAGLYDVIVGSSCGTGITSNAATLTVNAAPSITTDPVSQTVCAGTNVTFSVSATGSNLSYQWRKNGTPMQGFTVDSFIISSVSVTDAGSYDCMVTGSCSPARISRAGTLVVNALPAITVQPSSRTNCIGTAATFSVTATGANLTFQWRKDGVDIAGANSSLYQIGAVATGDAGAYDVVISGTCPPAVTSNAATLTVNTSPTITTEPSSASLCVGSPVTFSVTATGPGLTYQWRKDLVNLSGATNASYSISAVSTNDAGGYSVVVTGTCGSPVSSTVAALTVNTPPNITASPTNRTVCLGTPVTLSVTATGSGLTYQWRKDGGNIAGATMSTYTIASAASGDAGAYDVVVSGTCPSPQTSNAGTLTVNQPPTITTQPVAQTVCAGANVTLTISATGGDLIYQWRKNGTNIAGGNLPSLTLNGVTVADSGSYRVVVSNGCSPDAVSAPAVVDVHSAISITTNPGNLSVCEGSPFTLSVEASGAGISYQWRKNGTPMAADPLYHVQGANSASLTTTAADADDAGAYDVVLSNACGVVTSPAAIVTIWPVRTFQSQPESQTVCSGVNVTLSTVIAGGETGIVYQWKKNGQDLVDGGNTAGSQTASLTLTSVAVSDSGAYTVLVSGPCTPGLSIPAVLNVLAEPAIASQPTSAIACVGQPVTFSVTATGGGLTYQWLKNGTEIPGATTNAYTIASVSVDDAASYSVVVGGTCGSPVTSNAATLTVNTPPVITTQPVAVDACAGGAVTFTVGATGSGLTYQWRRNNVAIPGATSATYTIASTKDTDTGDITVVVSGACTPAVTSSVAKLRVGTRIQVVGQPRSQTVCAGSKATFSVQATGSVLAGLDFSFQWRKGGVAIAGATNAVYTIASVVAGDAGNYDVTISNVCGTVTSTVAVLTVPAPAECTVDPQDVTILEGATARLSVTASGSGLTYQWRKDGKLLTDGSGISGSKTAALTVPGTVAMAGSYDVVVKGTCGAAATSKAAELEVNGKPRITVQPKSQTVCEGSTATLSVTATGAGLSYQWKKNGVNVAEATSSSLTTGEVGSYTVVVGGVAGAPSVTSAVATLQTIKPIGTIGPITGPTTVCAGKAGLAYSVAVVSNATKYVWSVPAGARIVSGQGTRAITVTWGSSPGEVSVNATNACFAGTARTLEVSIPTLTITEQPQNQTLLEDCNRNVTFTVAAEGTPTPRIQWQASTDGGRSWMNLSGKTNATLVLANATPAQNGNRFRALLTTGCASVYSSVATLAASRIATTSGVTITPGTQQYSDKVTIAAAISPGVSCGLKAATNVSFYIGTRKVGTVALSTDGDTLAARVANVVVLEKPGVYPVRAVFEGLSPYFSVLNATNTLTVTAEDARVTYTGSTSVKSDSAGRATVLLKATVRDVTAVSGDSAFDVDAGKIVNARVAFVNRGTGQVIKEVAVAAGSDPKMGTASFSFPVNLGTESSVSYTIGVVVKNYYTLDDAATDQVITVRKP